MQTSDIRTRKFYNGPQSTKWSGRKTDPDMESQYWYQQVSLLDIDKVDKGSADIALVGYACDEGVRRNQGRTGAKHGPDALRTCLGKLPLHIDNKKIADVGDVFCVEEDLEGSHATFADVISRLIKANVFPIAIGGGHDMAYAHYSGIKQALRSKERKRVGIINFDAHFDLRPVEDKRNSGTPFYQILSENKEDEIDYFAIGIQQQSNTKELFGIAASDRVNYVVNYDCEANDVQSIKDKLQPIIDRNNHLYITIDLDGFSSAYAPGVSAPSPMGFTPYFVLKMLKFLLDTGKVISFDIAELNPEYDRDNLTANLAARLVDYVVGKV